MNISLPKLKALLLYFANNTNSKFLGKVKLMKLFYFLDFMHIKNYGVPVTCDTYVHLEHGPIPSAIKNLVDTAVDDGDSSMLSDTISFEKPEGIEMYRVLPTRRFTKTDEDYLSDSELKILKIVCDRFGDANTKEIEDASHKEAPWLGTRLLETIPYELAVRDKDCLVSEEEIRLSQKI